MGELVKVSWVDGWEWVLPEEEARDPNDLRSLAATAPGSDGS